MNRAELFATPGVETVVRAGILLLSLLAGPDAFGACEEMLGLSNAPVADLLLARPTVESLTYIRTTTPSPSCTVEANMVIRLPNRAELDWLDVVITRKDEGETLLEASNCSMVLDDRSLLRLSLAPGQRYTMTVAAFDVQGRKSEPVNLEIVGPGLGSVEWRAKAPYCRAPSVERASKVLGSPAAGRRPWPRAVAGTAGGIGLAWLMFVLLRPRKRSQDQKRL